MAIIPEGIFSKMAQSDSNNSPQEGGRQVFGIRHARQGGNTIHAELHSNERVATGLEGSQVIRDHDWMDLESRMVTLTVDRIVGKIGKVLSVC